MKLTTWLTTLIQQSGFITQARSRRRSITRLLPECLEARQVPAAVVGLTPLTPVLTNGVLTIIGNDSANTIDVTKSGTTISVLGKSFSSGSVSMIVIDGASGDDTIKVSESITQKTYLYGGSGSDVIWGGGGLDTVYGGSGADTIKTRAGNDQIYGGSGKDIVDGGTGSNSVNDFASGDTATNASTLIGEDGTLVAYSKTSFTGQVVNEVLRLVNYERGKAGLSSVSLNASLNYVASDYVQTIDRLDVPIGQNISHAFSGHQKPLIGSRLEANQVTYTSAGENNSYRLDTRGPTAVKLASAFMYGSDGKGGLMNSPGHRANILGASFTKLGLGLSGTAASGYYLTQIFTGG